MLWYFTHHALIHNPECRASASYAIIYVKAYTASTQQRVVGSLVTISSTKLSVILNPSSSCPTLQVFCICLIVAWSALIVSFVSGSNRDKTPKVMLDCDLVATSFPRIVVTLLASGAEDTITVAVFLSALMFTFLK